MPIEFRCTQCGKLLRTADHTAGKQAKCPGCGTLLTIPASSAPAGPAEPAPGAGPSAGPPPTSGAGGASGPPAGGWAGPAGPSVPPGAWSGPQNPYASPGGFAAAPFAGAPSGPIPEVGVIIDWNDVFRRAWSIFKAQWLMCAVAVLIVGVLNGVVSQVLGAVAQAVGQSTRDEGVLILCILLAQGVSTLLQTWLGLGQTIFFLRVARGGEPQIGDIFAGGPFFVNGILAAILVGLAVIAGMIAFIVPGIILALMFSQVMYLIVDKNAGVMDSLSGSSHITRGNKGTLFLMAILSFGIMLLGFCVCCIGVFPAAALVSTIFAVAYLMMTGQPTGEGRYAMQQQPYGYAPPPGYGAPPFGQPPMGPPGQPPIGPPPGFGPPR